MSNPIKVTSINECYNISDKIERRRCSLTYLEENRDSLPLFDINSIFHVIYGLVLGIISGYFHFTLIGAIILIPLNLGFHYLLRCFATIDNRNAMIDILLNILGFVSGIYLISIF